MATPTLKQLALRPMQPHALAVGKMVRMLGRGTSAWEIREDTGMHKTTIYRYICAMRKEGAIHIAWWAKDTRGREATPIYALGALADAKRKPMTVRERARRYRARKKTKALLGKVKHEH